MSWPVYLVQSLGGSRNHHGLFVETNAQDGAGEVFHVTGDIQRGMVFERKPATAPETSATFVDKTRLGSIAKADLPSMERVCRSNPPPVKQFNGAKRLDPKKPLRRCQEWTAETVTNLKKSGLLSAPSEQP